MRAIITSCLAALAVVVTAGAAPAQHGGGPGGHIVPGHSGGHAPAYHPPAHSSMHGGYAVQPGGVGLGVYAGPASGPAVGVYSGLAVVPGPYYSGSGYGYGHHRPHHLFHH